MIDINNDKTETYISKIRELNNAQLVVIIFCGPQRSDKYAAVKKLCCIEKPVPSQVCMQKTLSNPKKLRSVTQKIALQINCKLGGELWGIRVEQDVMFVGVEVAKGFTALVCSMNAQVSQYYSIVIKNDKRKIYDAILEATTAYEETCGKKPSNVVVYRSGIGANFLQELEKEANEVVDHLSDVKVTYLSVQKRTIVKLMQVTDWRSGNLENPPAGKKLYNIQFVDTILHNIQ